MHTHNIHTHACVIPLHTSLPPSHIPAHVLQWSASTAGDAAAAEAALDEGADVSARDGSDGGRTALHKAAQHGHAQVLEMLLGVGADIEATDTNGEES